jgi:hypothetical protein
MAWSSAREVPGVSGMRQIAALAIANGQVALAFVAQDGRLHAGVLDPDEREPALLADVVIPGAHSAHAPALAWLAVDEARYGASRVLGVFWRADGDREPAAALMQASALAPAGPFHTQRVRDQHAQPITSAFGPTLAKLGTGELCGVFTDQDAFIRFYCYDAARDLWVDLSTHAFYAGLGPQTQGQVGLAYHRYRAADGTPANGDASRGALYLSFTEPDVDSERFSHNPHFYVSEWLDAEHPAMTEIDFRWRGRVINQWTHLEPGTGVALYEDETLSALKGLMASGTDRPGVTRIEFLPLADGAYDEDFGTGNDFQVMERGICTRLRGDQACGGPDTASY